MDEKNELLAAKAGLDRSSIQHSTFNIHHSLLPYLRLVRAPAVFSALGDPLAGMLAAQGGLPPRRAARVAAAAGALYLGGMALNDLADREEDARERPQRPIPAGEVSPESAALLGSALLLAGMRAARGAGAGVTGTLLAGMVVAYNFRLKHSAAAGPVAMGACRALSLLMGAQAARGWRGVLRGSGAASVLGSYVAGLTLLARGETGTKAGPAVTKGAEGAGAPLLASSARGGGRARPWAIAAAMLAGPAVIRAVQEPTPQRVGPAVGAMVRAVPALDGALAAAQAPGRAIVFVPLLALVRWGRKLIPIE
jgi:hypothetical protein